MDVLVISACSGEKCFEESPIGAEAIDRRARRELLECYPDYVAPAAELYTGQEHGVVRDAVGKLRNHTDVTWQIVSAGYGLVDETDDLVAYDRTFSDIEAVCERADWMGFDPDALTHDETRQAVGREKSIPDDLRRAIDEHDLAFLVLSEPYLVAASDALGELPSDATVVAFASAGASEYAGEAFVVHASEEVRSALGTSWFRIRGEMLRSVIEEASDSKLEEFVEYPDRVEGFVPTGRTK
jgi:hypothetical protein